MSLFTNAQRLVLCALAAVLFFAIVPAASAEHVNVNMTPSLIRYYGGDNDTTCLADQGAQNVIITEVGSPVCAEPAAVGVSGMGVAYLFPVDSNNYHAPAAAGLPSGDQDRTVCGWVYLNGTPDSEDMLFSYGDKADDKDQFGFKIRDPSLAYNIDYDGFFVTSSLAAIEDEWFQFCIMHQDSNSTGYIYINGSFIHSGTMGAAAETDLLAPLKFGCKHAGGGNCDQLATGWIDEFAFYDKLLNISEIEFHATPGMNFSLMLAGNVSEGPPAPTTNITATTNNTYNLSSILLFNVSVANSTHNEIHNGTTGLIQIFNVSGLYWFNFSANTYYGYTTSVTASLGDNIEGFLHQVELTCLAREYVSNYTINSTNCTAGLASNITTNGSTMLRLNAETYSVNWSSSGYYSDNQTQTFSALNDYTLTQQLGSALISFAPLTVINNTGIIDFSVYLESLNYTWNETRGSVGAYVNWTYLINGSYSVHINATGYFNHSGTLTVANNSASYRPALWEAEYQVYAQDFLDNSILTDFSVVDHSGIIWNSSGNVTRIYMAAHLWNFTILKSGYVNQSWLYTPTALSNSSTLRQLAPLINYSLFDERTLAHYNVSITSDTYVDIFCTNQTLHGDFKGTNLSNIYIGVGCDYYLVKVTTTYNGSSYFRTLVPASTDRNVDFYMADLSTDSVVQRILNLIDLTGDFTEGEIRVGRFLLGAFRDIVRQPFDIEDAVTMYLMRDELYVLSVFDNEGTERSLGNLIADAAGEQTVTFPSIDFYPDAYVGNTISWGYTFNTSANILRVQYEDTANLTTWLRFTVFNDTGGLLFQTASNLSDVTITYNSAGENLTYISLFEVVHPLTDPINETKIWRQGGGGFAELTGWDADSLNSSLNWISWIVCTVVLLMFSQIHAPTGAVLTMLLASFLRMEGWLDISPIWLGVGWVVAAISFIQRRLSSR